MTWLAILCRKWRARQSDPNRAWEQPAEPSWEGAQGPGMPGHPDFLDTGVRPPRED